MYHRNITDMPYDPAYHHRRSIRLKGYDYTQPGAYFLTVCTASMECLLGKVENGEVRLTEYGRIVEAEWRHTAVLRQNVALDAFVIMPNHFHGIVVLIDTGQVRAFQDAPQFGRPVAGSLSSIVRSFKAAVAKRINDLRDTPGAPVWQRNYYEHVIRNELSLNRIRDYIVSNPANWELDELHPGNIR